MKELQIRLFLAAFACIISMSVFGQKLGEKNMLMMNNYIINNAASNMQPIKYAANYGIAEQASFNMIERFKMYEIKLIQVEEHDGIFTVQFLKPDVTMLQTGDENGIHQDSKIREETHS